eukprot:9499949-Pyramimonas_sp.AAC.1
MVQRRKRKRDSTSTGRRFTARSGRFGKDISHEGAIHHHQLWRHVTGDAPTELFASCAYSETLRARDSSPRGQPTSTSGSIEANALIQCWPGSTWPGWKQTQRVSTFSTSRSLF